MDFKLKDIQEKGAAMRLRLFSNWQDLIKRLRHKHRLVIIDSETLVEKHSFQLSGLNIFVAVGSASIVLILLTSLIFIFTPLHNIIPGFVNDDITEQAYRNERAIDSLQQVVRGQEKLLTNIRDVINGKEIADQSAERAASNDSATLTYVHSHADTLLRREMKPRQLRHKK